MMKLQNSEYNLVEREVQKLLSHRPQDELESLMDEIQYRLDNGDGAIDSLFMRSVLDSIPNLIQRRPMGYSKALDDSKQSTPSKYSTFEESLLQIEIKKGLDEGEEVFSSLGNDFIRPEKSKYGARCGFATRMPKFFNKVMSGIVWNKYAQTHYDERNPPPKQVLGYKFNIFYPELLDKSIAPKYRIDRSDTDETILLRFVAGAPYEDLVFKIINKEWELDRRSGFTCQFEKGVLQLYFVFKKDKYRR